jgi:pyrimidine operon attenuation protein/uracil phosphoribosyltransferase
MNETQLLDMDKTLQKIKRIAYQIYENNFDEKEIILAGINGQGYYFADFIKKYLEEISSLDIHLAKLEFDKSSDSQPDINITSDVDTFKDKVVIIIDDVLNTGRTLAYCLKPFLTIPVKKIQVAVLVDRNHPNYPIAADYVGYSLSTTITDHVKVCLVDESLKGVFLF